MLLLVLCSGCDLVIPLTEPEPVACGPYATIAPVPFDLGLVGPKQFSISYDGIHGMVHAKVQTSPTTTYTGPVPIVFDEVAGVWKQDRVSNMNDLMLTGGHMLGDGSVFGWRDRSTQLGPPRLTRFTFTSGAWGTPGGEVLDSDVSRNFRPGNEIVLPIDNGELRFFVEIKVDYNGVERGQIVIRQKFADDDWVMTGQAEKIADLITIDPSAAVMTAQHDKLVYAARVDGGKSRIYAALRNRQQDKFEIGRAIDLEVDDDLDDTEPWIAQDCSTLYFRRDGITYRAQ
jgi:hypothetical protein